MNNITNNFKPKSFHLDMLNKKRDGVIAIGADIGYSAPKIISPGAANSFPSYAKKIETAGRISFRDDLPTDIYIRDDTGVWAVGECAYEEAGAMESLDLIAEMYGRSWYNTLAYKTLIKASLGLALTPSKDYVPDAKDVIKIQTGLPAQYIGTEDTDEIKDAFAGHYDFEMKKGGENWESFRFDIDRANVGVMAQPLGSLMAVCLDREGRPTKDAPYYFSHNGEVDDYGFVTVDVSQINHGKVDAGNSYISIVNCGNKEIMQRTCRDLQKGYGISLQISELQNRLVEGTVRVTNKKKMSRENVSFEEILLRNSEDVFHEMFEKLKEARNYWANTDFIIQTGGTYEAWKHFLDDAFQNMDIRIVQGNVNVPELPITFANAWGFYHFAQNAKN